ncbi:alpha/beta hydrolase fold-containing protein 9 [Elsinoe australis]|uniref:Alpha/beta hydrolase fold-containing protein 9 n=1 Tax=Elsinoe australis TaxID=40998 RepID=A0A4U7B1T6_9PEZI|nr:alpha/beta hydrolase fold-containing protein 9 [Elsinoe australis]
MIDHVLGRPSVKFRKTQVFLVVAFWGTYLSYGHRHGPPLFRRLSRRVSTRLTAWQTLVLTLLYLYVTRNFGKLVGLECPEPLANLYTRSYFRATWVTTALDAGFWSAMNIRPKWLKDLSSVVFTVYYLICAEQADEKVRKVRAGLTLQHLRVSWDKPMTPYISFFTNLLRPKLTKYKYPPRELRIPRPSQSAYSEPVSAWLYFDGPLSSLKKHDKIILDIPGGGFVAMNPRCHDDKLIGWAGRTGLPVLALDYKKAPEYPYPYALNECYDVYHTLVASRGTCIGLSGQFVPKIVVSGDSAGGNLAVGMVLMILQSGSTDTRRWQGEDTLPLPDGVVLIYPALDMNIGNWMTDEQMALIKDRKARKTNQGVIRRKSDDYRKLTPDTPHGSDNEDEDESPKPRPVLSAKNLSLSPDSPHTSAAHTIDAAAAATAETKPVHLRTRLAMSSMISYFNDRILTPEMMRSMIILYIGPHSRPDFGADFLLSPLLAPESLLARFPKTYFLTGERDPLVDDTVIFAGRLRQAKLALYEERRELGLVGSRERFNESDWVNVMLVPGISHGFLQFVSVFPEGWKYIFRCAKWMAEIFREVDLKAIREMEREERKARSLRIDADVAQQRGREEDRSEPPTATVAEGEKGFYDFDSPADSRRHSLSSPERERRHHRRMRTGSSGDEDRPLEMSAIRNSPGGRRPGSSKKDGEGMSKPNGPAATVVAAGKAPRSTPESSSARGRGGSGAVGGPTYDARSSRREKQKSISALASSDDLLGRRMKGLTGNLMGLTETHDQTP